MTLSIVPAEEVAQFKGTIAITEVGKDKDVCSGTYDKTIRKDHTYAFAVEPTRKSLAMAFDLGTSQSQFNIISMNAVFPSSTYGAAVMKYQYDGILWERYMYTDGTKTYAGDYRLTPGDTSADITAQKYGSVYKYTIGKIDGQEIFGITEKVTDSDGGGVYNKD